MKNKSLHNEKDCILIFENGQYFFGKGFGAFGTTIGEVCFNTSITGYQEILTDPSYKNQIITFTFPHIGIVGTNSEDYESDLIHSSGCIVNSISTHSSNHRSEVLFHKWLKRNNKICISGIDTRTITRMIRSKGAVNALINYDEKKRFNKKKLLNDLLNFPKMDNSDLATEVSTKKVYKWEYAKKTYLNSTQISKIKQNSFIAVIDFGVKHNILNLLHQTNYKIVVFPLTFDYLAILNKNPVGIFLSNGPGDPQATFNNHRIKLNTIFDTNIPVFGICLGHQILALAHGAKTVKMHHGHRGANHPVKNLHQKNVEITVQNHGYVVQKKSLSKKISVTHSSLFDGTVAGIKIKNKPFFSVQYHPEASPGPHDSRYLFKEFLESIKTCAKKK